MGTINIVKTMKMIHPSCVIIVKIGNFYHVYGKDAYIFAYLLEYKITEKDGIPHCGFPISSISKVENILEKNKINYISVDRRNNYDEEEKYINKHDNKNNKNINKILDKIEKVIKDERGKV